MHTHRLGKVVSAWRVRRNLAGEDRWTLIDKRDPLKGQHFYPIQDPDLILRYGDTMAYRYTLHTGLILQTKLRQGRHPRESERGPYAVVEE